MSATTTIVSATVEGGKVILPPGVDWPDGSVVHINLVTKNEPNTLRDLLKEFEGIASDLPPDMAENHNHYIHGHPKK